MDDESIQLLNGYINGDDEAARQIFDRYVERLIGLARSRLSPQLNARVDPEDIVQSAYRSFFRKANEQQITLSRSGDLWRTLAAFTVNKVHGCVEYELAQKRDARRGTEGSAILQALHVEPSEEEANIVVDQLQHFMQRLDRRDRTILECRLKGHSVEEISRHLSESQPATDAKAKPVSEATVRRRLRWLKETLHSELFGE